VTAVALVAVPSPLGVVAALVEVTSLSTAAVALVGEAVGAIVGAAIGTAVSAAT
jgi:hypothetical protein